MGISDWSDTMLVMNLEDEPAFSEEADLVFKKLDEHPELAPDIVVSLQDVSHINSSNIAQLLRLRKMLTARDARMRICCVSTHVWSVLLTTGLDKLFTFNEDVMTAIASLQIEDA